MKTQFNIFSFYINNVLTAVDIALALNKFYNQELTNIDSKLKFVILFYIKLYDGNIINISSLQTLDKNEIEKLKTIFSLFWSYKSKYRGLKVEKIFFRFRFIELNIAPKNSIFNYPTLFDRKEELLIYSYTDLPNNILFET